MPAFRRTFPAVSRIRPQATVPDRPGVRQAMQAFYVGLDAKNSIERPRILQQLG
jgi:hypothetical protein